jgi:hypothetical protein
MSDDDNLIRVDFSGKFDRPKGSFFDDLKLKQVVSEDVDAMRLQFFERAIELGKTRVVLIPHMKGVDVPEQFTSHHTLALDFSHMFGCDVFEFDEQGIRATLSFGGVDYLCVVPWSSVFAIQPCGEPSQVFVSVGMF